MKSKGSYAALSAYAIAAPKMQISDNKKKISLLSVQNHEYGDWPISYNSKNNVHAVGCYFAHTRNNQVHYIYSWNSFQYEGRCFADTCYLHLCTKNPSNVSNNGVKDEWDGTGSALDINKLGIVKTMIIYAPKECEIAEGWISATDYSDCYAVLEMVVDTPYDDYEKSSSWYWSANQLSYYANVIGRAPSLTYDQK